MARAALLGMNPLWVMRTRNPAEQWLLRAVIGRAEEERTKLMKELGTHISNARVRAQKLAGNK